MNRSKFIDEARIALGPYLSLRGCFIYSAGTTLRENRVLLYGLNPGQNPEEDHPSNPLLGCSIANFSEDQPNLISTERWLKPSHSRHKGHEYEPGKAPYQQQVTYLLNSIEHPDALVTNLIFLQTRNADDLRDLLRGDDGEKLQCACWTVHQHLLNITKARALIAIGIGPYNRLCRLVGATDRAAKRFASGYGRWECRLTSTHWSGREIAIIGIPHLSWYRINRHIEVCSSVKKKVAESLVRVGIDGPPNGKAR